MEVDKVAGMVVDHVADMVTNMKVDMVVDDVHTNGYFYRTQVSLGSGLWVPVSLCLSLHTGLCETLLM